MQILKSCPWFLLRISLFKLAVSHWPAGFPKSLFFILRFILRIIDSGGDGVGKFYPIIPSCPVPAHAVPGSAV